MVTQFNVIKNYGGLIFKMFKQNSRGMSIIYHLMDKQDECIIVF